MKKITKIYKTFLFNLRNKINIDSNLLDNKSLDNLFNHFGTDKGTNVIDPYSNESNETLGHGFAEFYEDQFKKYKNKKMNILEIGTWEGASTASFALYFSKSKIYAIDRNFKLKFKSKRIEFYHCDINNKDDLIYFKKKNCDKSFKIIIDDGSHFLNDMISSLKFFFKYLDDKGFFVIEDFNAPEYFKTLDNSKGNEPSIKEMLSNINRKKKFKSKILNDSDQEYLFENITDIKIFKGKTKISDIAFLKKG